MTQADRPLVQAIEVALALPRRSHPRAHHVLPEGAMQRGFLLQP